MVRLSPDGKQLATANKSLGTVRVWDVATGKHLGTIPWDQDTEKAAQQRFKFGPQERRKHLSDYYLAIEYLGDTRCASSRCTSRPSGTRPPSSGCRPTSTLTSFHHGLTRDRQRVLRSQQTTGNNDGVQPAQCCCGTWRQQGGARVPDRRAGLRHHVGRSVGRPAVPGRHRQRGTEIRPVRLAGGQGTRDARVRARRSTTTSGRWSSHRTDKTLYVGSSRGTFARLRPHNESEDRSWKACANILMRIHLSPDGKTRLHGRAATGSCTPGGSDGKESPIPEGYIGRPGVLLEPGPQPDGRRRRAGRIDLWDATGGKVTGTLQTKGEPIVQSTFSQSGRLLAASDGKGWDAAVESRNRQTLARVGGPRSRQDGSTTCCKSPTTRPGCWSAPATRSGCTASPTGKVLWAAPPKQQMATFAMSPNGKTVWRRVSMARQPGFTTPTLRTGQWLWSRHKDMDFQGYEARFTFSPDSRVLALDQPEGQSDFLRRRHGQAAQGAGRPRTRQLLALGYTERRHLPDRSQSLEGISVRRTSSRSSERCRSTSRRSGATVLTRPAEWKN